MSINQITVHELKKRIDNGLVPVIVDVREPAEFAAARLPQGRLLPLGQLPERHRELDPSADIVVMCKAGGRSQRAADFLASAGFSRISNLVGGMDAWLREIGPGISG